MSERRDLYPGYDVLAKRDTPSWNAKTREVVDQRLAIDPARHVFFSDAEWETLQTICDRIVPQPGNRPNRIPVAAIIDGKMQAEEREGYRDARMPPQGEAWRRALAALDCEAATKRGERFHALRAEEQDALLKAMQEGRLDDAAWADMPPATFFKSRILTDVVHAYYAHPSAWNEIGWGGPASPRGYVRMDFDRRDPWEAAEAKPGREDEARRANLRVGEW